MPLYLLKNKSIGPRVVYGEGRVPISLEPGEEKRARMTEAMVTIMRQRDSDVVATPIEERASGAGGTSGGYEPQTTAGGGGGTSGGRVRPPREPREQQEAVEIPRNWKDLEWPKLRKLASSVSDNAVRNRKDAEEAIEDELAKRAG